MNNKNHSIIKDQAAADAIAIGLAALLGSPLISKTEYDKLNNEKIKLLEKIKDIDLLKYKLIRSECRLIGYRNYHNKWKPITRNIERKLKKLQSEEVYIDNLQNLPPDIYENLKEAYNCYIHGLTMASYIMILRTIEITISIIYSKHHAPQLDANKKEIFIPVSRKLNWVKSVKMIGGADYLLAKSFIEARNESIHEIFTPTPKQIISAFETILILVEKLNKNAIYNDNI